MYVESGICSFVTNGVTMYLNQAEFLESLDRYMIPVFMYRFRKSPQLHLSQPRKQSNSNYSSVHKCPGPSNETAHDLLPTPERQSPKSLVMLPNILTDRHGGPN